MRSFAFLALALALGACTNNQASEVLPDEMSATGAARQFVNGVGTPVHAVIKGASCIGTAAVALPLASLTQITGTPQDRSLREDTYKTVGRTCGGSYVLGTEADQVPNQ